ncbi:hypothetical protein H8B15_20005 [Hymenobacter sp. BT507]|uniref:Uncharacterized protein n=1 Tax=Hymenobacter citatus TaxID=2763506 RepID=A0ABR7MQ51_9BACT|nr:hypothetical protein [Hymenobacter citatus]MBC6613216.1 hypothetical protein [Hymenobacter citatus]
MNSCIYRVTFLLFLILLSSVDLYAQQVGKRSSKPFKNADTILLTTGDSAHVALQRFSDILLQQGYTIHRLDLKLLTLETAPQQLIPASFDYGLEECIVHVITSPSAHSTLTIMSQSRQTASDTIGEIESRYLPDEEEPQSRLCCFTSAQAAAKTYPGGKVKYMIRFKP